MQHRSSEHHPKHHHGHDRHTTGNRQTFYMPPELNDAPPYANLHATSNDFEALKPKVLKKFRVVEYKPDCECAKNGNHQVYEEDIDAEAKEFIALAHKKFELSKWMSMKGR